MESIEFTFYMFPSTSEIIPFCWQLPQDNVKNLKSFLRSINTLTRKKLAQMMHVCPCNILDDHFVLPLSSGNLNKDSVETNSVELQKRIVSLPFQTSFSIKIPGNLINWWISKIAFQVFFYEKEPIFNETSKWHFPLSTKLFSLLDKHNITYECSHIQR